MASIIDHNGVERKLGLLPPSAEDLALRASLPSFEALCESKGVEIIPEDQWEDVDADFGPEFVNDQHDCSGCVGWSAAGAEMKMRAMRGMPFEDLSGAFVYAHINGNRDDGASITSSMSALQEHGICKRSLFDYPHLFKNQIPQSAFADAGQRKTRIPYPVHSLAGVYTAIRLRFPAQIGVFVGRNFNSIDSDGVCGYTDASYANHSIHSVRYRRSRRSHQFSVDNSWGRWGIQGCGWAWIYGNAIFLNDCYVHVDADFVGN